MATLFRILIGGSNYGQAYLEALALDATRYRPVALLAHGSQRSQHLAAAHGLALISSTHELPGSIDMACLALPPAPPEALALLRAGIPVLCEHPQAPAFVEAALAAAQAGHTVFHVNAHFSRLPASTAFVAHARLRQQQSQPLFAMVAATDRSLFAVVDILAGVLGPPASIDVGGVREGSLFTTAELDWNGTVVSFQIQNRGPADGSPDYHLDYRIALGFQEGVATLLSLAGPVIWNANYARFGAADGSLWNTVYPGAASAADLRLQRAQANLAAVDSLRQCAATPNQTAEYLLGLARLWAALGNLLR